MFTGWPDPYNHGQSEQHFIRGNRMSIFLRSPQPVESAPPVRRPETAQPGVPADSPAPGMLGGRASNLMEEPYLTIRKKVHGRLLADLHLARHDPKSLAHCILETIARAK